MTGQIRVTVHEDGSRDYEFLLDRGLVQVSEYFLALEPCRNVEWNPFGPNEHVQIAGKWFTVLDRCRPFSAEMLLVAYHSPWWFWWVPYFAIRKRLERIERPFLWGAIGFLRGLGWITDEDFGYRMGWRFLGSRVLERIRAW